MVESEEYMKSTGIVRRIDDLGRIVIPKEIRKNLKIRDGDSLEIFTNESSIVLKKFSLMDDMISIANKLVVITNKFINAKVLITNDDMVIACSSDLKDRYLNQNISNFLITKLEGRMDINQESKVDVQFIPNVNENCSYFISPIIIDSDAIGLVILFSNDGISDTDYLFGRFLSSIFLKMVEE